MPKPRKKSANNSIAHVKVELTSPNLVQLNTPKNMEKVPNDTFDCHKNINSIDSMPKSHALNSNALPTSHALNSKIKVLPPPPRAFRDPLPGKMDSSKTDKIRNPLNNKPIIEDTTKQRIQNLEKISIEPGHSVPMRRKAKEINNIMDHSTSSLSR